MLKFEFEDGLNKLKNKWPNVFSVDQVKMLWDLWRKLPDGVFKKAVDSTLFRCVHCPSGERIQEEIDSALLELKSTVGVHKKNTNNCPDCDGTGYRLAWNESGNSTPVLCCKCKSSGVSQNIELPSLQIAKNAGYTQARSRGVRPKDWPQCDSRKYSIKLIAVFNVVQNSLYLDETRGFRGILFLLGLHEDRLFKLYELMVAGNTNDPLVASHNNNAVSKRGFFNEIT